MKNLVRIISLLQSLVAMTMIVLGALWSLENIKIALIYGVCGLGLALGVVFLYFVTQEYNEEVKRLNGKIERYKSHNEEFENYVHKYIANNNQYDL